jgi:hypothetical protein
MGKSERHDKGEVQGAAHAAGGHEARPTEPPRIDAAERLTIELARLRAKFGADPAIARASLDDAWMSPTAAMEEDEAEFIDAVADCLGVGLSLDAALTCWDSGGLFYDEDETAEDAEGNDDESGDGTTRSLPDLAAHHHAHPGARRVVVQ